MWYVEYEGAEKQRQRKKKRKKTCAPIITLHMRWRAWITVGGFQGPRHIHIFYIIFHIYCFKNDICVYFLYVIYIILSYILFFMYILFFTHVYHAYLVFYFCYSLLFLWVFPPYFLCMSYVIYILFFALFSFYEFFLIVSACIHLQDFLSFYTYLSTGFSKGRVMYFFLHFSLLFAFSEFLYMSIYRIFQRSCRRHSVMCP